MCPITYLSLPIGIDIDVSVFCLLQQLWQMQIYL